MDVGERARRAHRARGARLRADARGGDGGVWGATGLRLRRKQSGSIATGALP